MSTKRPTPSLAFAFLLRSGLFLVPEMVARSSSAEYPVPSVSNRANLCFPSILMDGFLCRLISQPEDSGIESSSLKLCGSLDSASSIAIRSCSRCEVFFSLPSQMLYGLPLPFGFSITERLCSVQIRSLSLLTALPERRKSLNLCLQSREVEFHMM